MTADLIEAISAENLGVYRASPIRLREDVSQEAQISSDYRGRLVYELLQNADDAMSDRATLEDRITFRLTDTDLWVGNSGRPLSEADVKGLCGIGASSKGEVAGRRRASIGHKGMGFKSVLEITAAPEVISDDYAFRMAAELAREPVGRLMEELGHPKPSRVPVMRFPSSIQELPQSWHELRETGIRTLFRFPLRHELTAEQRSILAERLLTLPVTTILFLKHLEKVEVTVETDVRREGFSWTVRRERRVGDEWQSCTGLLQSGIYRIHIASASGETRDFMLAHDADVEIGTNRGGLDTYAWEGMEVSEVSVAALFDESRPTELPPAWRHFHVFLPTAEPCPYPLLVNGAFISDLSRQELRVGEEHNDYNRFLMRRVAALFRDVFTTELQRDGLSTTEVLLLLVREADAPGAPAPTAAGQALYEAMRDELAAHPFLPREVGGRLPLNQCVVPPLVPDGTAGERFRELLPIEAVHDGRSFPVSTLCGSELARIMVDHGAIPLSGPESASLLGETDLTGIELREHASGGLLVDPVLEVLQGLWEGLDWGDREEFAEAVRGEPLFPVGVEGSLVRRVVTDGVACFYPPRTLKGTVPLERLSFLMQELCWGALVPSERTQHLRDELVAWQALFELREFKFPDVMRASVLPALELDPDEDAERRLEGIRRLTSLAAICQLSGRTPDPRRPLRYERLGTTRALFNLSRLPVPCRVDDEAELEWRPAYQVYLGENWLGDASIERVIRIARRHGADVPNIPLLAGPEHFDGLLAQFRHLEEAVEGDDEDEVGLDEDEDAPPDQAERDRWIDFLTWIGVNRVLRPVHFHDVEDRATGWLTTKDLRQPDGWAFRKLPASLWDEFRQSALRSVANSAGENGVPYLYRVEDLEHIVPLLKAAQVDASTEIAEALFLHLTLNWAQLESFTTAQVAVVPSDLMPSRRSKPPHAYDDELVDAGDNLWVLRLRSHGWCPTSLGPRQPDRVWLRTAEVERRFGRQGSDAGALLPLLDVDMEVQGKARGLAASLGIRVELTPSNFTPQDARGLLDCLERRYANAATTNQLRERELRQVIRPAYRNLMELLPGSDTATSPAFATGALANAPLLVHDGRENYRFDPSDEVLYADRSGTRERLGAPQDLWTFILEATQVARGPLTNLLRVRVLEDEVTWSPDAGDPPFDSKGVGEFRAGVRELAPYILARLGAERQEERLVAQDSRRLRDFAEVVQPVVELSVRCRLKDRELGGTVSRDAFVQITPRGMPTAFVVWGSTPWPPTTPEEAEALATALSDLLDVGHFEALLTLINAPSDESRLKLLRLAGAPIDLAAAREALTDELGTTPDEESEATKPDKTPGESTSEEAPTSPAETGNVAARTKTPLFRPEELLVDGVPVTIVGDTTSTPSSARRHTPGEGEGNGRSSGAYGGHTDLDELNSLGMNVALTFERNRLQREGLSDAEVLSRADEGEQARAVVFDVSTLAAIERARACSKLFRDAFAVLETHGLSVYAPGFDILTLNPRRPQSLDRLIELKSSGVNARLQEMSWNEWKSARNSELRKLFYLYLIGNLRSDLGDAVPFIRAVHDPFATIWAEEVEQDSTNRKVQLHVTQFAAAEHLNLQVHRASSGAEEQGAPVQAAAAPESS